LNLEDEKDIRRGKGREIELHRRLFDGWKVLRGNDELQI
jgi:hypothetical protein